MNILYQRHTLFIRRAFLQFAKFLDRVNLARTTLSAFNSDFSFASICAALTAISRACVKLDIWLVKTPAKRDRASISKASSTERLTVTRDDQEGNAVNGHVTTTSAPEIIEHDMRK